MDQRSFLRAVPIDKGESSIALLLLWEADHGTPFPTQAVELRGRLSTFTKRLKDTVGADHEMSHWLSCKQMHMQLSPGLPSGPMLRWSVHIDSEIGEPFMSIWKTHLLSLARQHQSVLEPGPPKKRLQYEVHHRVPQEASSQVLGSNKRVREGSARPPPLHTKEERIKRLKAAQAAAAEIAMDVDQAPVSDSVSSFSRSTEVRMVGMVEDSISSSSSLVVREGSSFPAGVASHAGQASPGAIT